jgi:hypothetical protein
MLRPSRLLKSVCLQRSSRSAISVNMNAGASRSAVWLPTGGSCILYRTRKHQALWSVGVHGDSCIGAADQRRRGAHGRGLWRRARGLDRERGERGEKRERAQGTAGWGGLITRIAGE